MHRRRKSSSGQALVLVTLALFSMVGMMGLAVDLGWSYFVQKAAQASADAAALGAVQEAYTRLGSGGGILSGFTCGSIRQGTGAAQVDCETSPIGCGSVAGTSNLNNGCQYAKTNGFDYTSAGTRQIVTIESGDGPSGSSNANRPGGVNRIVYWARVRTIQTIPQLFSAIEGNKVGTVAANATAGLVGEIVNASFIGLNQANDCTTATGSKTNCGVDVNLTGTGNTCAGGSGNYNICAPAGMLLASTCHGTVAGSCSGYAGTASSGVFAPFTNIQGLGQVNPSSSRWTPTTNGAPAAQFGDPTTGLTQPPLAAPANQPPPSCGILDGHLENYVSQGQSLTLGPYQYYSYHTKTNGGSGTPIPNGAPITFNPNQQVGQATTVNFANTGACPGISSTSIGLGGTSQSSQAFPMYVFYGGLNVGPNTSQINNTFGTTGSATVNFGAGQYVMAGTSTSNGYVFSSLDSNLSATSSAGSLFIFTNGNYSSGAPGAASLTTMMSATVPNSGNLSTLTQGQTLVGGGGITLDGLSASNLSGQGSALTDFGGVLFWQDRRNSTDTIDPATGKFTSTSTPSGVTSTSPQMTFATGGGLDGQVGYGNSPAGMAFNGVIYQPRGAWTALGSMISEQNDSDDVLATSSLQLQLISGAIIQGSQIGCEPENGCSTPSGDFSLALKLLAPTNALVRYKAALIQ
jgi:Flp pilus assembly protein TadG